MVRHDAPGEKVVQVASGAAIDQGIADEARNAAVCEPRGTQRCRIELPSRWAKDIRGSGRGKDPASRHVMKRVACSGASGGGGARNRTWLEE
jgi:hypothetical protein